MSESVWLVHVWRPCRESCAESVKKHIQLIGYVQAASLLLVFDVEASNLLHAQTLSVQVLALPQPNLDFLLYPFQLYPCHPTWRLSSFYSVGPLGHSWFMSYYRENSVQTWIEWWYPHRNECGQWYSHWCYLCHPHVVGRACPNLWFQNSPAEPHWSPDLTSSQNVIFSQSIFSLYLHLVCLPVETVSSSHSHPTIVQCSLPSAGTKAFIVRGPVIKHVDHRVMSADPCSLCFLGVRLRSVQLIALQL